MTRTIGDRPAVDARPAVGDHNLALLCAAMVGRPGRALRHVVTAVHGPAGAGKTRLLHAALALLPAEVRVLLLDGGALDPTPGGVRAALRRALGGGADDLPGLARSLSARPGRHVLAVDSYERLGPVDAWLRTSLLPALPTTVRTVLVGRDRPSDAWRTSPGRAGSITELEVTGGTTRDLGPQDRAPGHPVARELTAAAVRAGAAPLHVLARERMLATFVGALSPDTTLALEAACTMRRRSAAPGPTPGGLSDRELQVLGLLAEGLTNRDIATTLHISGRTAGRHVSNIFAKLDVHTRARATRFAADHGLLDP